MFYNIYIAHNKDIRFMVQSVSSASTAASVYEATGDVKTAITVQMMQEMQKSQEIAGSIIQDAAQISQEAMAAYQAEQA